MSAHRKSAWARDAGALSPGLLSQGSIPDSARSLRRFRRRCSAKIESGRVEQPGGMISEESQAQGYALMCVAYPTEDCKARVIPEVSRVCGRLGCRMAATARPLSTIPLSLAQEELVDAIMNITA